MEEIWKKVFDWPEFSVSNLGRVRRDVEYSLRRDKLQIGEPTIGNLWFGYLHVPLSAKGKKATQKPVHVLVLESFISPKPLGLQGRHLNDIKTDNRLDNLAWGTSKQNHEDAKRNGIKSGFHSLSPELRTLAGKKAVATKTAKKILWGLRGFTLQEKREVGLKDAQTRKKNGTISGMAALSKEERYLAVKKGWITRKQNLLKKSNE